jgi:tripartite-type tricarboxylate transporter receptor subunit TctC
MKKMSCIFIAVVGLVLALVTSPGWTSDKYPSKAIQLICPFAAGGTSDLSARIVGNKMGEILGQPIVVMNKTGGGSSVGINFVAGSKPDGYTILTASAGMVLIPMITPQLPYKMGDLVPLGRLVTWNNMIVVGKDLPVKTFSEFVAYARKNPNTLSYSSSGVGNTSHFIGEFINMELKLDVQHIPYPGENPAITAVLGNHAQVSYVSLPTCLQHVRSGAVKALAVFSNKRDPELPQVPSSTEEGYPDLLAASYHIFYASAKTPPPILKQLETAFEKALQDKEVSGKIEALGLTVSYANSQETRKFLDNEYKKWSIVAKKANIVVK